MSVIKPLENLKQLRSWESTLLQKPAISPRKRVLSESKNKVLFCHDMMGGYLDDRFIEGTSNCNAYRLFHWSKLDSFVYFSHNFVTIPPLGWIIAGHKHGVKVFGTIITEWDKGAEICQELLESKETVLSFCRQICEITKFYGFDGWLLNIENKIREQEVDMLVYLAQQLTIMIHDTVPESEIIWYDSVICTGELKWQDELNILNRKFFDVTDGIFLNYNWDAEKLQKSRDLAELRFEDVYVGVDVFGRGTKQLEGFECHKIVQEACDSKMSIAIFAQGWVYEVLGKENFLTNECKFWSLLCESLPLKAYSEIPFKTSFCQGFGLKKFNSGKVCNEKPWHNLCLQEIQPSFRDKYSYVGLDFCLTDAFNGGSSLKLVGELSKNEFIPQITRDFSIFNLKMDVPLSEDSPLLVSYVFKVESGEVKVGILLETSEKQLNMLLTDVGEDYSFDDTLFKPSEAIEYEKFNTRSPILDETDWIFRCYVIKEVKGMKQKLLELKGLSLRCFSKNPSNFAVLLGEVDIRKG